MFIAFEGIDGSGKTTLSLELCEYLNSAYLPKKKESFIWTKEPAFSSEEADKLNNPDISKVERESLFLSSRISHQDTIRNNPYIVCDRYLWSALAYTMVQSPIYYSLLKKVYTNEDVFIPPDLYIYVTCDVLDCRGRLKEWNHSIKNSLESIERAYEQTKELIKSPIITIDSSCKKGMDERESIRLTTQELILKCQIYIKEKIDEEDIQSK